MVDIVKIPCQLPCDSEPSNVIFMKKPGDKVEIGDPLFSYEYDGALFLENAATGGEVLAIFLTDGDSAPFGTPAIAISDEEKESVYEKK